MPLSKRLAAALAFAASAVSLLTQPAAADPVPFDSNWREQGFSLFSSNRYELNGSQVNIQSDGTVSLIWRNVFPTFVNARNATWRWSVQTSVPGTDLTIKGGDDRNASIYFVFTDDEIDPNRPPSARKLLGDPDTRALVYIWGGSHPVGSVLQSPYAPGLRNIILKAPGTGDFIESVDLAADYQRAFGAAPGQLVGLAISADSDDTDTSIRASIGGLVLN